MALNSRRALDSLRALAEQDPETYKAWKAENPKAYTPGQPMIVDNQVFAMRPAIGNETQLSLSDSEAYKRALVRQATKRNEQEYRDRDREHSTRLFNGGTTLDEDRAHIQSQANARNAMEHPVTKEWLPFFEAQRAIQDNSGREARMNVGSLRGLPTSVYDTAPGQSNTYMGTLPGGQRMTKRALDALRKAAMQPRESWDLG